MKIRAKKELIIILILLLLVIAIPLNAGTAQLITDDVSPLSESYDWPMFQHDAANTGLSQSSFPDSFTELWHAGYNEDVFILTWFFLSSPVIW